MDVCVHPWTGNTNWLSLVVSSQLIRQIANTNWILQARDPELFFPLCSPVARTLRLDSNTPRIWSWFLPDCSLSLKRTFLILAALFLSYLCSSGGALNNCQAPVSALSTIVIPKRSICSSGCPPRDKILPSPIFSHHQLCFLSLHYQHHGPTLELFRAPPS